MAKKIEEYVALNEETVTELKAGDKVVFLGDSRLSDDSDMVIGKEYDIVEGFGESKDFMMQMITGGYAGFIDDAGDECAITRDTAQGFAKVEGGNDNA